MADNYLWDNQSPNPTSDVENPSPAANDVAESPSNSVQDRSFSTSKAVKLALGLTAVAGAVALGVVLGLNSSSDETEVIQAASSASTVNTVVAENNGSGKASKSTNQVFSKSSGSFEAEVKMVSSSITNGYETCSDLEKDLTEALELYISNYIKSEAENSEMYAKCDPDNENWYWEYYGYDDYYYHDHYNNETSEANETVTKKKAMPRSSIKQTRSSLPLSLQKQTRSSNQRGRTKTNGNGAKEGSGFEQNSQNDNVNEKDKVVSDGSFIYAAYGDVLQVWSADGSTEEVSMTKMPGDVKDCDWNTTEPCTSSSKPSIQALFLGNGRLTAIVSQYLYDYGTSETDQTQPIISDYGSKLAVVVYDVSDVTLDSPLKELASEELTGSFLDGGSIGNGDKTVIATSTSIDTWALVEDISRSQPQYCGLNTTAYTELAKSTAESQITSLAKQMVTELELVNDCSGIFQVSSMLDGSIGDAHNLMGSDFLLGYFVQLFTLDVSSADGGIPSTVSGSFSPSYGYNLYITDDFIALPSSVYFYNSTTGSDGYSTFILGFDLSADGDFKPSSFGHIPGEMYSNYRMDKKDGYLRLLPSDSTFTDETWISMDAVTWTTTYLSKVYVLELPSTSGAMSLVGESKLFGEDGSYFVASSRFSGDLAFISGDDYDYKNQLPFVVIDISDPTSPKTVGSLQIDCSLSYLEEIEVNGVSHILGIGTETDSTTYESYLVLALIDVSAPTEPKLAAYHKSESGSYTDATYDFLSARYFDGSLIIPLQTSKYNETTYTLTYKNEFVVYGISETDITPALNVIHPTVDNYCYYEAAVPPRSFVVNSELTTIKDHTAIKTDMAGNVLSELDLDKGFNYSVCPDYYYYDVGYPAYAYNDDANEGTDDST